MGLKGVLRTAHRAEEVMVARRRNSSLQRCVCCWLPETGNLGVVSRLLSLISSLYPSHRILSLLFLKHLLNPPLFHPYCISLKHFIMVPKLVHGKTWSVFGNCGDFSAKWNLNPFCGVEGLPGSGSTSSPTFAHYHSAKLSSPRYSFNSLISCTCCPLTMECPLHCISRLGGLMLLSLHETFSHDLQNLHSILSLNLYGLFNNYSSICVSHFHS